ncbi:MAG: hypothetical protein J7L64_09525 [Acidobacteria bacterium]|nr:hypothetical protein [Acidobacteriota bacterium]
MKKVKLSTGYEVVLDGDLMAIVEALYREVAVRSGFSHSYHDMKREIELIVSQMSEEERKTYLTESLFLNTVTYENQMIEMFLKRLKKKAERNS